MQAWLFLLVTVILTAAANLLLKYAATRARPTTEGLLSALIEMCTNVPLILGIGFLAIAVISYSISLRQLNLSIAYPIMTTSVVVLVAFFSAFLFQEPITLTKAVGTVIVICGVILLSQ